MSSNDTQLNLGPIILIVVGLWFAFGGNIDRPTPEPPDDEQNDEQVDDRETVVTTEADVWQALGDYVASGNLGEMQRHTDHVLQIARELKQMGRLTDISRLDSWQSQRQDITAGNLDAIVRQLNGR